MEKEDTILLLLIVGSIITIIFGIDLLRLVFLLVAELGTTLPEAGPIARMAVGVAVMTTIIIPILIIILNILAMKVFDESNTVGIIFGFITLGLCIITIIMCTFFIFIIGTLAGGDEGGVVNIVMRIRGSLGVCIAAQILVLVGAIMNLGYVFNK